MMMMMMMKMMKMKMRMTIMLLASKKIGKIRKYVSILHWKDEGRTKTLKYLVSETVSKDSECWSKSLEDVRTRSDDVF